MRLLSAFQFQLGSQSFLRVLAMTKPALVLAFDNP